MVRVTPPDLEAFLTGYVRTELAGAAQVTNKEPTALKLPLSKPLVILRDDSGSRLGWTTFGRSVGVSVLAGASRQDDKTANDLARLVLAILTDDAIADAPGSPIATVDFDATNGPYAVIEELDIARRYATVGYTVVGT